MINKPLEILTYPHPILLQPSEDIDIMGEHRREYLNFIEKMFDMYNGKSEWGHMVGLAAPQVGKNWNVFIALNNVFINPKMEILYQEGYSDLKEGCYSLVKDKFDYPVRRAYKVNLSWIDQNGESFSKKFVARDAQVIQHEFDHLQGKLCVNGGLIQ